MSKPFTILAIDDDREILFALSAIFKTQGWATHTAADVEEGLERFEDIRPDLVLIDYHMPRINGVEGVRMLRGLSAEVPILVFTIDEDPEVADQFMDAGASDFALKPIKAPDLVSRIRLHMRLGEQQRAAGEERTQKGIGQATLLLIKDAMEQAGEPLSAEEVAIATGLAYQTTYRYLQYMQREGAVTAQNSYGKVGRPKQYYELAAGREGEKP